MNDNEPQGNARAIVEKAIDGLVALGMARENAAGLLAAQGLIRMPSLAARRALLHLIDSDQFEDPAARDDDDPEPLD